jgi:hypothetical protein
MIRNPIGFRDRLDRLRGSTVELDLRPYDEPLAAISEAGSALAELLRGR